MRLQDDNFKLLMDFRTNFGIGELRMMICIIEFDITDTIYQSYKPNLLDIKCSSTNLTQLILITKKSSSLDQKHFKFDGLDSLKYKRVALKFNKLFTWILVDLTDEYLIRRLIDVLSSFINLTLSKCNF